VSAEKLPGQFEFLNKLRKERRVVSLYLVSGIRFLGRIVSFDREGLLLDTKHGELLFAQRQISTIGPEIGKARSPRSLTGSDDSFEPRDHDRGFDRPAPVRTPFERTPPERTPHFSHAPPVQHVQHVQYGSALRDPSISANPAPRPAITVQIIRKARREIRRDLEE